MFPVYHSMLPAITDGYHTICHHKTIKIQFSLSPPMTVTCTVSTVSAFIPFFLIHPISSYWLNNAPNIRSSLQNFTIEIKILTPDMLQTEEAKTFKSNSEYWL